jgi:hypothetical protein
MRATFFILFFIGANSFAQKPRTATYYAELKGLFYSNRLILTPLDSNKYLLEYYFYGGDEFLGAPRRDTFFQKGRLLKSKNLTAVFDKNVLTFTSKEEGSKRFKFKEMQACDSIINITRNWTYRELVKRTLTEADDVKGFGAATDPILSNFCHEDFVERANEIKQELRSR